MGKISDKLLSGGPVLESRPEGGSITNKLLLGGAGMAEPDPGIFSMFTGEGRIEKRHEDIPEFRSPERVVMSTEDRPAELKFKLSGLATSDPLQLSDIILENFPETKRNFDRFGNPLIEYKGKTFFVNKPGASGQDLVSLVSDLVTFAPAAKIASLGKTVLRRMGRGSLAAGATEAGRQEGAEALGAERELSSVLTMAAFGGIFEGLAPGAKALWKSIFRRKEFFNPVTGKLSQRGETAARSAGLDPQEMGKELNKAFDIGLRRGMTPQEAQRAAQLGQFGIKGTRGEITGDTRQLSREVSLEQLAGEAGDVMRAGRRVQAESVEKAGGLVQERMAGQGPVIGSEREAGELVAGGLSGRANVLRRGIDEAFEQARTRQAGFRADAEMDIARRARKSLREEGVAVDPELTPAASRAFGIIRKLEKIQTRIVEGAKLKSIKLETFELQRRKINNLFGAAKNPADRKALTKIKEAYDEFMDDAVDNALFEGDDDALEQLLKARELRFRFGEKFEPRTKAGRAASQDEAGKFMKKLISFMDSGDGITGEETANWIYGKSLMGAKDASRTIVKRIKDIAGEESDEMSVLRQAFWRRMTRDTTGEGLRVRQATRRFDTIMNKNSSLIDELFTGDQKFLIDQWRKALSVLQATDSAQAREQIGIVSRLMEFAFRRAATMATFRGQSFPLGFGFAMAARLPGMGRRRAAERAFEPVSRRLPAAPELTLPGLAGAEQQ